MDHAKQLESAYQLYQTKEFGKALTLFSFLYDEDPSDLEAKAGVLLCSTAVDFPNEAQTLLELYTIVRSVDEENAYDALQSLVDTIEAGEETLKEGVNIRLEDEVEKEDGILYRDFKALFMQSHDFSKTFQDIFFSTRVIITEKEDFFDFIEILIEHGFYELAMNYIENANQAFPSDEKLSDLLDKLQNLSNDHVS